MSDDAGNEYFSDGISEELLNLLAKIPELRVISRSSAFSFKGRNLEIPEIARRLNVAHILEGSVRKAGNQVRITAQLIDARSDSHLWSETYDRTLDDIFAIQDEIAEAVVEELKIELLGERPRVAETNPEAYALYLQAQYFGGQITADGLDQAIALYRAGPGDRPLLRPVLGRSRRELPGPGRTTAFGPKARVTSSPAKRLRRPFQSTRTTHRLTRLSPGSPCGTTTILRPPPATASELWSSTRPTSASSAAPPRCWTTSAGSRNPSLSANSSRPATQ